MKEYVIFLGNGITTTQIEVLRLTGKTTGVGPWYEPHAVFRTMHAAREFCKKMNGDD